MTDVSPPTPDDPRATHEAAATVARFSEKWSWWPQERRDVEVALVAAVERAHELEAEVGTERDEMVCDVCHRRHGVIWFAPSDIWNATMRDGNRANPDRYSFCCPICFIRMAEEVIGPTTGWLVMPFADGPVARAEQVVFVRDAAEYERLREKAADWRWSDEAIGMDFRHIAALASVVRDG